MNICVIPARGGSKRIPRKNIRDFCGKPMLSWSIEAALTSNCFDQVIVSTDDKEISSIAKSFGATIPFTRPSHLSDDYSTTQDVVSHAVSWYQASGHHLESVCCLYATAPFVQCHDLESSQKYLQSTPSLSFVFSATSFASSIHRAFAIDSQSGLASMFYPELFHKRSQDLKTAYHDAAQFYWGRPEAWLSNKNLFENSRPYLMPRWRVQDIDEEEDWIRAECLYWASTKLT